MSVKKGNIPWNKGKKTGALSEEHKKNISKANKGRSISEETKRKQHDATIGNKNPFYGRHHTKESIEKMSKSQMGIAISEETRKKISKANKGKKRSMEAREKYRIAKTGKKNPMFGKKRPDTVEQNKQRIGEKNPVYIHGRAYDPYSIEFIKIRESIRLRDGYKCQKCGLPEIAEVNGWKLPIHHIDDNKTNNSRDNLITLCVRCNNGKVKKNPEKWTRYFQKKIKIITNNSCLQLSLPIHKTNVLSKEIIKWL